MAGKRNWKKEIKRGNITLCILYLLEDEPMYGYQIISELRKRSDGYFDLKEGTIYPALYRLEKEGYVTSQWLQKDDRPPRNYYQITSSGKEHMQETMAEWISMVNAIRKVVEKREGKNEQEVGQ